MWLADKVRYHVIFSLLFVELLVYPFLVYKPYVNDTNVMNNK